VIAGKKAKNRADVDEVAEKTVSVLKACVPAAVLGTAFLVRRFVPGSDICTAADLHRSPQAF
jgi:Fructose-bisphosphate aldolase class-I